MSTCSDCNWFSTRESYCSKHHKKVKPDNTTCGDFWPIKHTGSMEIEGDLQTKICPDCTEEGYSIWNEFNFCPFCGKRLG